MLKFTGNESIFQSNAMSINTCKVLLYVYSNIFIATKLKVSLDNKRKINKTKTGIIYVLKCRKKISQ